MATAPLRGIRGMISLQFSESATWRPARRRSGAQPRGSAGRRALGGGVHRDDGGVPAVTRFGGLPWQSSGASGQRAKVAAAPRPRKWQRQLFGGGDLWTGGPPNGEPQVRGTEVSLCVRGGPGFFSRPTAETYTRHGASRHGRRRRRSRARRDERGGRRGGGVEEEEEQEEEEGRRRGR